MSHGGGGVCHGLGQAARGTNGVGQSPLATWQHACGHLLCEVAGGLGIAQVGDMWGLEGSCPGLVV